jgi:hypothetical protein
MRLWGLLTTPDLALLPTCSTDHIQHFLSFSIVLQRQRLYSLHFGLEGQA